MQTKTSSKTTLAKGPLREVTSQVRNSYGTVLDVLSCGHKVRQAQDIIGPVNRYRRRCRICRDAEKTTLLTRAEARERLCADEPGCHNYPWDGPFAALRSLCECAGHQSPPNSSI